MNDLYNQAKEQYNYHLGESRYWQGRLDALKDLKQADAPTEAKPSEPKYPRMIQSRGGKRKPTDPKIVGKIKWLLKNSTYTQQQLADMFGIGHNVVWHLRRNLQHKKVKPIACPELLQQRFGF